MIKAKLLVLSAVAIAVLSFAPAADTQVAVGVNIGPAPICPYGYFDYAPYDCAPYGLSLIHISEPTRRS